ncbi:MAG: phosphoribosylglycinamide formyltransferase [Arcobacter butzleri]|jgi:phosphoribosylglycinamide formyltransferase-1|nr:phosphoribosylglycinamide formyltransferase [Arcobacteraceae bacterium]MDY0365676.1 phosphoribosylglycinamide formyltransferase [Arcobacteraceae bacterium]NLO17969.1 phosphoribosylglycinamide formyltransferase [Aliarcobacter butzleri]
MNLAIFASYNGSILEPILENIQNNTLNIKISLIITNNSNAFVIQKAKKQNIPYKIINQTLFPNQDLNMIILDELKNAKIDYILLAGYMKKIDEPLIKAYPNKIINTHPSLLPKYGGVGMYGRSVHEAVLKNREKESGVTAHYVDSKYDEGVIIAQKSLKIDSLWDIEKLEKSIKNLEQIMIIDVLRDISKDESNISF